MRPYLRFDTASADGIASGSPVASAGFSLGALEDRCIEYRFSDASVGRDMHTIAPDAWDTRNFEANPVFLWAHQDDELPVGRVEKLDTVKGNLIGQVRYAEHDFADTVYSLVKGGFLNATSTGWLPQQWKAANDRNRPGGLDFTRVELLEISQVPVPALPTALVTARKAGIDTRPLVAWAERLLDTNNFAILPHAELVALRKAAAEPRRRAKASGSPADASAALAQLKPLLSSAVDEMTAELVKKLEDAPGIAPEKLAAAKAELIDAAHAAKAKIAVMAVDPSRSFNPDQPRDDNGEWTGGGDSGGAPSSTAHEVVSKLAVGAALIASAGLIETMTEGLATVPATAVAAVGLGMIASGIVEASSHALDALQVHPNVKADVMGLVHQTAAAIKSSATAAAAPARAANSETPMPKDFAALLRKALARDLGTVAELAMHLRSLEDLHDRMSDEADREGDGGPNMPAMRAWLDDGHKVLAGVLGEESAEDSAGTQDKQGPMYWSAADLESAVARALDLAGFKRKGAKYSAETVRCIRDVHGHVRSALDGLSGILSEADDENPEDEADDPALNDEDADDARALRARKARALAMKAKLAL